MDRVNPIDRVNPTTEDPLVRSGSEVLGGPIGRRAAVGESWWSAPRVLVVLALMSYAVGYLMRLPCRLADFTNPDRYVRMCYSDLPFLYYGRGFSQGLRPYLDTAAGVESLEYPVLTGGFMWIAALLTGTGGADSAVSRSSTFYDWNAVLLLGCFIVAVLATALTVRRRPWDAALVALSPALIMTSLINWDLLTVALTAVAFLLWSRHLPLWSGVMLGLAISAKFYPLILIGAFALLCLRAGRLRSFALLMSGAVGAWLAVNLPFIIAAPQEWLKFYEFSRERAVDFGSVYLALQYLAGIRVANINTVVAVVLVVLVTAIAVLIMTAERRPRLAQIAFLLLVALTVSNKVYSPQFVLWLLPFAVLARPRWRDLLIWQAGQVQYVIAVWLFLEQYGQEGRRGIPDVTYAVSILIMVALTLWFAGLVVRDILRPEHDPVRSDGVLDGVPLTLLHADDPGGGVLDGAPDRFRVGGRRYQPLHAAEL
jgi:uncharacterized membrane protein